MAYTEMSLPIDIPWKRMGVSEDMIDPKADDLKFPEKWQSSIAVFYHEPAELPPEYCNRKITYLKIVATITNYQLGEDITILDQLQKQYGDFYACKTFGNKVGKSYPCYGALLQVAVFPSPAEGVALHDFPYISAFQPVKREMYEMVSESGEITSGSSNKVNVSKGTTNTDTTETYDLDLGGGGGFFGLWSHGQEQKGTVERVQKQKQDITTTDASREKRESHSYSTSINQLYSLLQGYHLGTNRAIFFMQPRPHVQDLKFTFIRGPRRLEGIQEFFLIVDRPASVPGFCVEVALETAHVHLERAYFPRLIPYSDLFIPGNLEKTSYALGIDVNDYPNHAWLVYIWNKYNPWVRHLAHEAATQQAGYLPPRIAQAIKDGEMPECEWFSLCEVTGKLPDIGTEEVRLIFEEYESDKGYIFVVGRRLSSCVTPVIDVEFSIDLERSDKTHISTYPEPSSIVYWKRYLGPLFNSKLPTRITEGASLNTLVQDLNETLWSSIRAADRKPYGEISFFETDFILEELSQLIRLLMKGGIQDQALSETDSLRPFVERGLGQTSGAQQISDLGTLPTDMIARDLNVTTAQARKIRREILVSALSELDEKTIDPEAPRENPILERFTMEFPKDKLRKLDRSSRIFVGESIDLHTTSGISRAAQRLFRFFYIGGETRELDFQRR